HKEFTGMNGSQAVVRSSRRYSALAAVGALIATLLSILSVAPPARAADNISFRAAAEAALNLQSARVAIPAAVVEGDGLLLFVTTNKADIITATPEGWTLEGTRVSRSDTETTLYSKVATAGDAGRNTVVPFSSRSKSTITVLAYDGTATDPVASFAS